MDDKQKKIALVTGGARGLGRAISLQLAKDDFFVIVNYNKSENDAEELVAEIKKVNGEAINIKADVSNYDAVKNMVNNVIDKYEYIDVLVNNAGIRHDKLLVMMKEEEWDKVINTNLKGIFNCSKFVGLEMIKNNKGKIINISSVSAFIGTFGQANYVASKAAIIGMTKTMAREMAKFNVYVNAVAPGFIDTDIIPDNNEKIKEIINQIPQQRIGQPEEVANLVSFIASDKLTYSTGHVFYVDGGLAI